MLRIDNDSADCLVFTFKEGFLAVVAHDLKIKVGRFEMDVDEAAQTVEGRFDAASLRVVCAMSGGGESKGTLSASQKKEIEANIVRDVLGAGKYPEIRFTSSAVDKTPDGLRIKGQLSLHGKRKTIEVSLRKEPRRYVASARVHQPDFGIKPYSALLGALKVKADVEIRLVVPWPLGK